MYVMLILNRKFPLYICYSNCYEYERYIDLTWGNGFKLSHNGCPLHYL